MNKVYVVDTGGENYIIRIANFVPQGSIGQSPMHEGKQVKDIDWLDILDVDDGFGNLVKTPTFNVTKKADKDAANQAAEDVKQAAIDARDAKLASLKGLNPESLTSLPAMRDALIDVMEYLGLR